MFMINIYFLKFREYYKKIERI